MKFAAVLLAAIVAVGLFAQTPGTSDLWWQYPSSLGDATNFIAFNLRYTPVVANTNIPPWTNWPIAATTKLTNATVPYGADFYVGVFVTNSQTGKEGAVNGVTPVGRQIY